MRNGTFGYAGRCDERIVREHLDRIRQPIVVPRREELGAAIVPHATEMPGELAECDAGQRPRQLHVASDRCIELDAPLLAQSHQ